MGNINTINETISQSKELVYKIIDSFDGEYSFLSNFYPSTIVIDEVEYKTVEHAYQASKTNNKVEKLWIINADTAGQAKRLGQKVMLRDDWEDVKISVMRECLKLKFQHEHLKSLLLQTNNCILIEGNNHKDRFWGMCNGVGFNMLGILLMERRVLLQV